MCVMSLPSTPPPAGWYPDPQSPVAERYWEGNAWSPHTRPRMTPAPMPAAAGDMGPSSSLHYLLPVGRSWQAVSAPYPGVFGLLFCLFPPAGIVMGAVAIALGVWALVRARSGGHGSARAIVAIVTGAATILLSIEVAHIVAASST